MLRNRGPSTPEREDSHRIHTILDLQTRTPDSSVSLCTPAAQVRAHAQQQQPRVHLDWDVGSDQWCDKEVEALWTVVVAVAAAVVVVVAAAAVAGVVCCPCLVAPMCNQEWGCWVYPGNF